VETDFTKKQENIPKGKKKQKTNKTYKTKIKLIEKMSTDSIL
jgi:hypothetical protein